MEYWRVPLSLHTATGALYHDINGNLAGGATQFATLTLAAEPMLMALVFVVI